jgi:hypothetical protein
VRVGARLALKGDFVGARLVPSQFY